jgi:hypothetical protein
LDPPLARFLLRRPTSMVSWTHEGLVRVLAERPDLAVELLALGGHELGGPLRRMEADLTDLDPAELRADLVLTSEGAPRHAVIVEVQLAIDPRKRWSWPAYAATLRARYRCDVTLVVVAVDAKVAAWCAEPFRFVRGVSFAPIVLGPKWIPRVVDPHAACADLELALLSALAHPEPNVLGAAFGALQRATDTERAAVYADILVASIDAARLYWEAMMQERKYEFQSEFARKYVSLGREEGREQGREEGRQQGREEGREQGREDGLRLALLRQWSVKFGDPEPEQRAMIESAGPDQLERWLDRILVVESPDGIIDVK